MREKKRVGLIFVMVLLVMFTMGGLSVYVRASEDKKVPRVGPVKLNPHPASLEGKTVLLRWNGKYNGDRFLIRIGELMTQQVKDVKIIKMWEVDKSTVAISKNAEVSEQVAVSIAKLKPDLVIAAQAD
jgi:predicted transcriptional regulator with HTH domain